MITWLVHGSFLLVCLGIPVLVAYRSGRYLRTWAAAWAALIGWFFVMSMFVGPLFEPGSEAGELIPEGPSVVAALFMGWLPAAALGAAATVGARLLGGPPGRFR